MLTHVAVEAVVVDEMDEVWNAEYLNGAPVFFTAEPDEVDVGFHRRGSL